MCFQQQSHLFYVEFKEIGQFILQVLTVFPEMSQRGEDL